MGKTRYMQTNVCSHRRVKRLTKQINANLLMLYALYSSQTTQEAVAPRFVRFETKVRFETTMRFETTLRFETTDMFLLFDFCD